MSRSPFALLPVFALLACDGGEAPPAPPVVEAAPDVEPEAEPEPEVVVVTDDSGEDTGVDPDPDDVVSGPITVRWSQTYTTPGCWTFSSASLLGREATYTEADGAVTIDFARPVDHDAVFTGAWSGDALELADTELFDYGAGEWQTTERMRAERLGSTVRGEYLYTECALTDAPETCPANGRCITRARFSFELP